MKSVLLRRKHRSSKGATFKIHIFISVLLSISIINYPDYEAEPKVFDNGSKMTEEKKRRKKERRTEALNDQMFEFVKNQCGRHSVSAMGIFLNMPKSTLHERIKKAGITFVEREEECHFCELKKNNEKDENISNDHLFPFLR